MGLGLVDQIQMAQGSETGADCICEPGRASHNGQISSWKPRRSAMTFGLKTFNGSVQLACTIVFVYKTTLLTRIDL